VEPATPPAAAQRTETITTTQQSVSGQWRGSKLVGLDVYNNANEKIGDISEILLDPSGKITGVIIGVGGFLGLGQHDVLVPMDLLKFVNEPVRTTTTTTTTTTTGSTTGATAPARPARSANEKWYPDHAVMNATKDQLKAMPAFKYN
jgi:sporulation protein YlmC with PRC-barrel domain